jgi:RNA polymerase sigma-70 factor (ECF subfamily)
MGDTEAVLAVLAGEVDTYALLVQRHTPHVMHLVARHVPAQACEDIAQETFIRAYEKLGGYTGAGSFRSWLSGIAVNLCMDYWRRKQSRPEVSWSALGLETLPDVDRLLAPAAVGRFEAQVRAQDAEALTQLVLGQLGAEDRTLLTLGYMQEYSTQEIAQMLGWSRAKVKVRAFRARKRLRRFLATLLERGEAS